MADAPTCTAASCFDVAAFAHESKPGPLCHKSIMLMYKLYIVTGAACNLHIVQLWLSVEELRRCHLWAF